MARQIIERMIDDLTGETIEPGDGGTIEFTVSGATYSIDLTRKNAEEFYAAFGKYIDAATKVSPARGASSARAGRIATEPLKRSSKSELQAMREWARAAGYQVAERGRVSAEIQEAYRNAH